MPKGPSKTSSLKTASSSSKTKLATAVTSKATAKAKPSSSKPNSKKIVSSKPAPSTKTSRRRKDGETPTASTEAESTETALLSSSTVAAESSAIVDAPVRESGIPEASSDDSSVTSDASNLEKRVDDPQNEEVNSGVSSSASSTDSEGDELGPEKDHGDAVTALEGSKAQEANVEEVEERQEDGGDDKKTASKSSSVLQHSVRTIGLASEDPFEGPVGGLLGNREYLAFAVYTKASTPGCTKQCRAFSSAVDDLEELGCRVVGVSLDSETAQKAFQSKSELKIDIICKNAKELLRKLGCLDKSGKLLRSVIVIGKDGNVCYSRTKISPDSACSDVLEWLRKNAETHPKQVEIEKVESKSAGLKDSSDSDTEGEVSVDHIKADRKLAESSSKKKEKKGTAKSDKGAVSVSKKKGSSNKKESKPEKPTTEAKVVDEIAEPVEGTGSNKKRRAPANKPGSSPTDASPAKKAKKQKAGDDVEGQQAVDSNKSKSEKPEKSKKGAPSASNTAEPSKSRKKRSAA